MAAEWSYGQVRVSVLLRRLLLQWLRARSTACQRTLGAGAIMWNTCSPCNMHAMPKTLQIRDVPDDLHATIRARAAHAGQSVSDYLLELLGELVSRPTMAEIVRRAEALARAGGGTGHSDAHAALRERRDR
jgi:plasmid stability protein